MFYNHIPRSLGCKMFMKGLYMDIQIPGTIYLNNNRYWWKVKLPGASAPTQIPLKAVGSKFATKDRKFAELIAAELWARNIKAHTPISYDGRLSTLIKLYNQNNEKYYLPPSRQAEHIAEALILLAKYFPSMMAEDFNPLYLKEFRSYVMTHYDWTRQTINRRIEMVKRMFKWAASEMLISIHTYTALTAVEGLRRGRTDAREGRKILPVKQEAISAVLKIISPIVADMIQIQLLTGMRPGELCIMRACDIDQSADIWIYKPQTHKTQYLDHSKTIVIGPRAQAILVKYLYGQGYSFKTTREHYTVASYRRAIARACKKAGVEKWSPHQLRHNRATSIRFEYGLDAARAVLGHRKLGMTDNYAEIDAGIAKKIMGLIG